MSGDNDNISNVERLMRELNIEQLTKIQSSLKQEMENKREELRQMVGRRYRDVLEASQTVKRLTEIANELGALLAETRENAQIQRGGAGTTRIAASDTNFAQRNVIRRFMLLYRLLPLTFTSTCLLTRAFALSLADGLHRLISADRHHLAGAFNKHQQTAAADPSHPPPMVEAIGEQLLLTRLELLDVLTCALGDDADWRTTAGNLAAVAQMKRNTDFGELLNVYLNARMDKVVADLAETDSTLLGLIRAMKDTVQCVEQLFGSGEALRSAFQCIATMGWSPATIQQLLDDQPLGSVRLLKTEIAHINTLFASASCLLPSRGEVQQHCSQWIVRMCSVASERVRTMCTYFERVDQAVEFAIAVDQIFKSDWPSAFTSNALIYRQLFGEALLQRFQHLVDRELHQLEQEMRRKLPQTNCTPSPLFHKNAVKFDALLVSGVSHELDKLVQQLNDALRQLLHCVAKYTTIGHEEGVDQLHDLFADQVLALVDRLTDFARWNLTPLSEGGQTSPGNNNNNIHQRSVRHRWLSVFRLLLALVQHEPSVLCQCMNRSVGKIVRCNQTLHAATEQALCHFMDLVVEDCLSNENLSVVMLDSCKSWDGWLALFQEPERVQLNETATIEVPTQMSRHFFLLLCNICREVNNHSLGHLFTRNVTLHTSRHIGNLLAQLLLRCAEHCAAVPLIWTQLLFDCKALFAMFPDKHFLDAAQLLEAKMEPIELNVLQEPLARNAKLFVHRTTMLFGLLQAESNAAPLKEGSGQLLPSYTALIDLTPKAGDVPRLTQIPRLSRLKEESQRPAECEGGGKQSRKQQKAMQRAQQQDGLGLPAKGAATSSFSSLYDKISTGWFKS